MTAPADFATCDLCDAHGADPGLRVLPPVFASYGGRLRFCGAVSTVKCFEDNSLVRAAVEGPGQGRVLVVDGGGSMRRALLGGKLSALAVRNGWAGVLVDGCVRDVAELAAADLGVRALASQPMPPVKRGEGQRDVAVQVQGAWVRPGDWLYADADGVLVSAGPLS
jgi:regulator of ribonuclease activity A